MSQKRQTEEEPGSGGGSGEKRRKGGAAFRGLVMNVVRANRMQNLLSTLEPLLRRVVKEEVEKALSSHLISIRRQCGSQVYPSSSGSLQLNFRTTLRHPIFTGAKIEGYGDPLAVVLLDPLTGCIVKSGPESSLAVEIVVLEGDFEADEEDNWTFEEFSNNVVKEREGKRCLLAGDVSLILAEGTGIVKDLSFTDNSSWTRSRKFRLGAKVETGHLNGIRIREAKTEPFIVKDHRGELYKKHYPPSLEDEVWRLEKIGKDGAFHKRLSKENIVTVHDFLKLLSMDASRLRSILGGGMSNKMWEVTVEHARTCVLTKKRYAYYEDAEQRSGVVYNEIGELKGLISQRQYIPVGNISDLQKEDAMKLMKVAYGQPDRAVPYASEESRAVPYASEESSVPLLSSIPDGLSPPSNLFDECSTSPTHNLFSCSLPAVSTPDMLSAFSLECMMDDYRDLPSSSSLLHLDPYRPFPPLLEESRGMLLADKELQYFTLDRGLQQDNLSADSPSDVRTAITEYFTPHGKMSCKKIKVTSPFTTGTTKSVTIGWGALLSVVSWLFSIKRIVASKRRGLTRPRSFGTARLIPK